MQCAVSYCKEFYFPKEFWAFQVFMATVTTHTHVYTYIQTLVCVCKMWGEWVMNIKNKAKYKAKYFVLKANISLWLAKLAAVATRRNTGKSANELTNEPTNARTLGNQNQEFEAKTSLWISIYIQALTYTYIHTRMYVVNICYKHFCANYNCFLPLSRRAPQILK